MSESDSDLDFESADEDAEFVTINKENKKSIPNDDPSGSLSAENDILSSVCNESGTSNVKTGTNTDGCASVSSDLKIAVENSGKLQSTDISKYSQDAHTDYCGNVKQGSSNTSASTNESKLKLDEKFESSLTISEQKTNAPMLEDAQVPSSSIQVDKSATKSNDQAEEIKTQRERVVLRLEKKKQLSRELPSENEKPSDFVNILHDPNEKKDLSQDRGNDQAEEIKTQRERVVLRLEKKKQLSRELPSENEKPSDFVNILHDPNEKKQASSWGFSSWGSSLLSSAASSVSTFSNQVSQGIGTVLETVESTLGAPPPEELAQTLNEKKAETTTDINSEGKKEMEGGSGLLSDVSSWTKVFENTSSKVIMGGLDTLELIGKKTMDILTEGDPGFRKKRAAFSGTANLSEVLREIKARADEQTNENCVDDAENVHYSQIFDEKQGLVHLEALEMLSKQSQAKFQRLLMRHSKHSEVKKRLEEIKSICENVPSLEDPSDCENFEDFEAVFKKYTLELSFPLNVENIIQTQRQISKTICNYENTTEDIHRPPKEIFQSAICSLAEFTAKCIETFHKAAELILVQPNLDPDLENCATNLTGLTTVMCIEVNNLSSRYHKCLEATAECLQKRGSSENTEINILATNVYVEASNSNNYIQDAYQMLVPVLQVRFLEAID